MMFFKLATQSLANRKSSVLLTILAITISVFVLLSVEHIRHQAKQSFNRTVSGVDLIVGPRTGQLNLLLSSVFRLGNTGNSIDSSSVEALSKHPMVSWAVPIALGDSHKGYRVMATTDDYFSHFKYGAKQPLAFKEGKAFLNTFDLVLGAELAKKLNYRIGQKIVLSHGTGVTSFTHHEQTPFTIVGILSQTGTPVDQTIHVSFEGLHHMHEDESIDGSNDHAHEHKVSAVFVGLKARYASLVMQKWASEYKTEPLSAIMPGVALTELWRLVGSVETVLQIIAILVLITTLMGLSTMLLASMRERTREIAILRVLGASPLFLFALIQLEVLLMTTVGCVLAVGLLWGGLSVSAPLLASELGLFIEPNPLSYNALVALGLVLLGSLVMGLIPAINAYRHSLQAKLS